MISGRSLWGRPSGLIPTSIILTLALVATSLFVLSPTLNPLDILGGRMFQVIVPEVIGMTQTQALVRLEDSRLQGAVGFDHSASVARGYVMGQTPGADGTAERGETVDIVVSEGPAIFTLRDYTGERESLVKTELEAFELEINVTRVNDEDVREGTVISHDPEQGEVMLSGGELNLVVSLGPVARPVPDLLQLPFEGALFLLGKSGFELGELTFQDDPFVPTGAVVSTDPPPGTNWNRDDPVDVVVSSGPPAREVPRVINSTQGSAAAELSALGFIVGEVSQLGRVGDPKDGIVLNQTPRAGTILKPGEIVTLTVRRAQSAPPTTAPLPPPPPPTTTTTTTTPVTTTTTKPKPKPKPKPTTTTTTSTTIP